MDKIFDTPIEYTCIEAVLLKTYFKKFINNPKYLFYYNFTSDFIIPVSINGLIKQGKDSMNISPRYEPFQYEAIENHKLVMESYKKYGEEWIQNLKTEFIRIHRFVNFDPLDVYKKNQELIVKNEKLEKQMSEIETMVLYLSKELENLKKPNKEIPNLIDF